MKISEFANVFKVSERHVRRLINKYESELVGHYVQRGNDGTYLDDEGVEILKSKLRAQFDVVPEAGPSERERQLESTITELSMRYAAAMEKLAESAGSVALLEAAKENVEKLEARVSDAEDRARTAEYERLQVVNVLEGMRREAKMRFDEAQEAEERALKAEKCARAAEDVAELNAQEAERAKAEAADLKAQLDAIAGAGRWKRKKLVKKLRKEHKAKLKEEKKCSKE